MGLTIDAVKTRGTVCPTLHHAQARGEHCHKRTARGNDGQQRICGCHCKNLNKGECKLDVVLEAGGGTPVVGTQGRARQGWMLFHPTPLVQHAQLQCIGKTTLHYVGRMGSKCKGGCDTRGVSSRCTVSCCLGVVRGGGEETITPNTHTSTNRPCAAGRGWGWDGTA